ncbi:Ig-like domain-containing protein [Vibrio metschnikovii]
MDWKIGSLVRYTLVVLEFNMIMWPIKRNIDTKIITQPTFSGDYAPWQLLGSCDTGNAGEDGDTGGDDNQPPTVEITLSTNTAELGDKARASADADDSDGQVAKVEFFISGQRVANGITSAIYF